MAFLLDIELEGTYSVTIPGDNDLDSPVGKQPSSDFCVPLGQPYRLHLVLRRGISTAKSLLKGVSVTANKILVAFNPGTESAMKFLKRRLFENLKEKFGLYQYETGRRLPEEHHA